MKATIILNQEHNGIEIAFDSRPSYETRCNRGRARRNRRSRADSVGLIGRRCQT